MTKKSGVTLLEAMVTMALVSLTLAITAGLMKMYSRGARLVGVRSAGYQALEAVMYQLRSEAMGAVDFRSPASVGGAYSASLEFRKVDRSVPNRLRDYPTGWSPYNIVGTAPNGNFLVSVRFEVQDGALVRGTRPANQSSFESYDLVSQNLAALGTRLNADNTVDIRLEVEGTAKTRFYETRLLRRVR